MTTAALTYETDRPAAGVAVCAGRVLVLAGVCFGAANLFQWGVQSGALGLHPAALALSWPVAVGVFFTGLFRLRRAGGEAARTVAGWSRLGVALMVGSALALAAASALTSDWELMRLVSAATLALYGMAWIVALSRTGRLNMGFIAVIAFAGSGLQLITAGTPDQYVFQALTLALVALLPGLWLALGRRL